MRKGEIARFLLFLPKKVQTLKGHANFYAINLYLFNKNSIMRSQQENKIFKYTSFMVTIKVLVLVPPCKNAIHCFPGLSPF